MDETQQHIEQVCAEAGFPAMVQIYEIVRDRGEVPNESLLTLTDDEVIDDFFNHIGPAVDRIEERFLPEGT